MNVPLLLWLAPGTLVSLSTMLALALRLPLMPPADRIPRRRLALLVAILPVAFAPVLLVAFVGFVCTRASRGALEWAIPPLELPARLFTPNEQRRRLEQLSPELRAVERGYHEMQILLLDELERGSP
jgi:hypothetical protein